MSAPELLFETTAPLTGHNSTWHLEYEGRPVDVKLERGDQPVSITALDTGREFKLDSKRGAAIAALVLEAYHTQFGDDMDAEREQEFGYICKACNGPAPAGIGYIAEGTDAADASKNINSCACGYSTTERN